MITLNALADNIKTMMYPNTLNLEAEISSRQIKYWIHYHRAKLITDNIDKGILNSTNIYQVIPLIPRNSTNTTITNYIKSYDAGNSPAVTSGIIENSPKDGSDELTAWWLAQGYMSRGYQTSHQGYMGTENVSWYGEEVISGQVKGDFRNNGYHSFNVPSVLMLNKNGAIKKVQITRKVNPDGASAGSNYRPAFKDIPYKNISDYQASAHNKFTDRNKPFYTVIQDNYDAWVPNNGLTLMLSGLQISPNYFGGYLTPNEEKIFWSYNGRVYAILSDPTTINDYNPINKFSDSNSDYPIPSEYIPDLIQRVIQQEANISLKTMASE